MGHKAAVVGARGYSGIELCRLIMKHPKLKLSGCYSRNTEWKIYNDIPELAFLDVETFDSSQIEDTIEQFDTLFLAAPPKVSMSLSEKLRNSNVKIIDISGAFRLESEVFEKWYGIPHTAAGLIKSAVYGLSPWADREELKKATLISNPGCYATSVLMALIPLVKAGVLDTDTIVIDAKSGTTGAGRDPKEAILFSEVHGNIKPYKVGKHQHLPEIQKYCKVFGGTEVDVQFTTHLLPVAKGISTAIYSKPSDKFSALTDSELDKKLGSVLKSAYKEYPLIRIASMTTDAEAEKLSLLTSVTETPLTNITFSVVNKRLYIFVVIDNLMKGASSQAIENWNISNGFSLTTGLGGGLSIGVNK